MTALPDNWLQPPLGGWTLADIQRLPEGSRVEVTPVRSSQGCHLVGSSRPASM